MRGEEFVNYRVLTKIWRVMDGINLDNNYILFRDKGGNYSL